MFHLKVSIILLLLILFISFLSFFKFSDIQEGYKDINNYESEFITVRQVALLSSLLRNIDCDTASQVINSIKGMKLNNPHFEIIINDRNSSDYDKLVLLKETINYVSSKSTVFNNKTKNTVKQEIISNKDEPIKDEITVENTVLIKNIIDRTDLKNADNSIEAIRKLDLQNSIVKPILELTALSSYNRILFVKYIIDRILTDSNVNTNEMDKTWKQYISNPTASSTIQPTSTPSPTPTQTTLSITTLSPIMTTAPVVPTSDPYILNGGLIIGTPGSQQFPNIPGKKTLYIIAGTGTLTITYGFNLERVFLVGGGAGGSSKGYPGLGGLVINEELSVIPKSNETYILNISVGEGGAEEKNGILTSCECSALNVNYVAYGGGITTIPGSGSLNNLPSGDIISGGNTNQIIDTTKQTTANPMSNLPSTNPQKKGTRFRNGNLLYYGGSGGNGTLNKNAPLGGGGGGGGSMVINADGKSGGDVAGKGGGISVSLPGGEGGMNGSVGKNSNYGGGGGGAGSSNGISGGNGGSGTNVNIGSGGSGGKIGGGGGNGGENTGGGGGGGGVDSNQDNSGSGGSGGSGIIIFVYS